MIQPTNPTKDYHACRTHVSRGMLADLAQRPRLFEGRYITGELPQKKPTREMQIGTAIHALALEGRSIGLVPPDSVLAKNGARSTNAYYEWEETIELSGCISVKSDEYETINRASAALVAHLNKQGIDPAKGVVEKPIYWERADGMACRAMPDLIVNPRLCLDVKTTGDISDSGINSSCFGDFAYWMQPPQYLEGIQQTYDYECAFVFVFVETAKPYGIREYALTLDDQVWASNKRERLIEDLKRRTDSGDWSDPEEGGICEFKRPNWCK